MTLGLGQGLGIPFGTAGLAKVIPVQYAWIKVAADPIASGRFYGYTSGAIGDDRAVCNWCAPAQMSEIVSATLWVASTGAWTSGNSPIRVELGHAAPGDPFPVDETIVQIPAKVVPAASRLVSLDITDAFADVTPGELVGISFVRQENDNYILLGVLIGYRMSGQLGSSTEQHWSLQTSIDGSLYNRWFGYGMATDDRRTHVWAVPGDLTLSAVYLWVIARDTWTNIDFNFDSDFGADLEANNQHSVNLPAVPASPYNLATGIIERTDALGLYAGTAPASGDVVAFNPELNTSANGLWQNLQLTFESGMEQSRNRAAYLPAPRWNQNVTPADVHPYFGYAQGGAGANLKLWTWAVPGDFLRLTSARMFMHHSAPVVGQSFDFQGSRVSAGELHNAHDLNAGPSPTTDYAADELQVLDITSWLDSLGLAPGRNIGWGLDKNVNVISQWLGCQIEYEAN